MKMMRKGSAQNRTDFPSLITLEEPLSPPPFCFRFLPIEPFSIDSFYKFVL